MSYKVWCADEGEHDGDAKTYTHKPLTEQKWAYSAEHAATKYADYCHSFRDLDDKARLRILRWAIRWHQEHANSPKQSALQILVPAIRAIADKVDQRRVLDAVAVLLDVNAVPSVALRSEPYRADVRKRSRCSVCGLTGHNKTRHRYNASDVSIDRPETQS